MASNLGEIVKEMVKTDTKVPPEFLDELKRIMAKGQKALENMNMQIKDLIAKYGDDTDSLSKTKIRK